MILIVVIGIIVLMLVRMIYFFIWTVIIPISLIPHRVMLIPDMIMLIPHIVMLVFGPCSIGESLSVWIRFNSFGSFSLLRELFK